MNQNMNNEIEVEEAYAEFFGTNTTEYSQEYLDFINSLDVVPVAFDSEDVIEEFSPNFYEEYNWEEINTSSEDEVDFKTDYQLEEDFWTECNNDFNFPQPEPKYFKVSPFELIPQKKYFLRTY